MWRDVELRELRIFLVLADELHFGRTARRLSISQPAVSEAVRVLETRLGGRLLARCHPRRPAQPASPPDARGRGAQARPYAGVGGRGPGADPDQRAVGGRPRAA